MGIDPQKLAAAMLKTSSEFWRDRTLMSVRLEFDRKAAALLEPMMNEAGLDACEAWFSNLKVDAGESESAQGS